MKYSYAVHVLKEELARAKSYFQTDEDHIKEAYGKRIADLQKALKKLGYSEVTTQDDGGAGLGGGEPGGGGGGPGTPPGP